jgi:hypothetical protein
MRSIRKFAYATVLALSIFAVQPTPVAAEEARGAFTLSHEVRWQNCVLQPGAYTFSVKSMGSSEFLVLRGLDGTHTAAMMLVNDVGTPKPNEESRLILVSRNGRSFVSAMTLPEYEMTLHFAVPKESAPTPVERAAK